MVLGTAIGRVKANDQDIGENAQSSYDIIDGDGTALFEITSDAQAQDGVIRLRKVSPAFVHLQNTSLRLET